MEILAFIQEQWMLSSLLLVLVILYFWQEARRAGQSLSIHAATKLINSGDTLVVDLRDAKDFAAGHIVDAINIPYTGFKDQKSQLEKSRDKTILLVDKLGQHSGSIGRMLKADGFTVSRLGGGMSEWQAQNLPVVKKR